MADKQLYSLVVPSDSQTGAGSTGRRSLNAQGVMSSDVPSVTSVAPEPGERTLSGQYRLRFARLMADQLEELFKASGFSSVPYFAQDRENPEQNDGYYTLSDISVDPIDPRSDGVFSFDGTLIREGTQRSHFRGVSTAPTGVRSPWGGNPGAEFAISALATKPLWYNEVTGEREPATPVRQNTTENGPVDVYNADDGPGESPTLLFNLGYEFEYLTDCRVWDDFNRDKELIEEAPGDGAKVGSATVGNATVGGGEQVVVPATWQRVFLTDHYFVGKPVVESGALRLVPDEVNDVLRAYRWNEVDSHWDSIQLGSSSWRLYDFDLTGIAPEKIEADLTFKDTAGSDFWTFHMVMQRGFERARFLVPNNYEYSDTPTGVTDRIAPIARFQNRSAQESQTLVPRREVSP